MYLDQDHVVEIKEELKDDSSHPRSKKRIAHTKKTPSVVKATKEKVQVDVEELNLFEESQQEECKEETKTVTDYKGEITNIINISHTSLPTASITTSNRTFEIINSPADICVKKSSIDTPAEEVPLVKSRSVHWSSDVTHTPPPSESLTEAPAGVSTRKPFTGSVVETSSQPAVITVSVYCSVSFNPSHIFSLGYWTQGFPL